MKEQLPSKYITHNSGLPIRIPPYLRLEINKGNPDADIQLSAMQEDPYIGKRNTEDTVSMNFQENVRLRRIARKIIAPQLVKSAEEWGIQRYTVLVHGSLAKGLVRNPASQDPSDIDIDLIIDNPLVSKEARREVRKRIRSSSREVKIDSYVWNMHEIKSAVGEYARYYLRSAVYPVIDKGNLWKEILWVGIESQRFLNLPKYARRKLRTMLPLIAKGRSPAECVRGKNIDIDAVHDYFRIQGLLDEDIDSAKQKAAKLCLLIFADQPKEISTIFVQTEAGKNQSVISIDPLLKGAAMEQ